jgi:hypothetical protein
VSLQPAIPRRVAPQQSPLPLHQSPRILANPNPARQSNALLNSAMQFRPSPRPWLWRCARRVHRQRECHLYFARLVSSLSCADNPGVACDEFVERPERVRVWRELNGNEMGAPVTTLPGKAGAVRSSGPCRNCSWVAPLQTGSRAAA